MIKIFTKHQKVNFCITFGLHFSQIEEQQFFQKSTATSGFSIYNPLTLSEKPGKANE